MDEQRAEQNIDKVEQYLQRVRAFLAQTREWCADRDLTVLNDVTELKEEGIPKYQAPSLCISKDNVSLAEVVPFGSAIIAAQGRIDLIGKFARHAFLFRVGEDPSVGIRFSPAGITTRDSSRPRLSRVDRDGWYWVEARVRRAKHVDESLFIDLLTDVSDYEFE
jgi:hypothetical protein